MRISGDGALRQAEPFARLGGGRLQAGFDDLGRRDRQMRLVA
jgi:hypothetical protein